MKATVSGAPAPHALRDYALLADGERGALVGPRGEIVWMCAPAWDSDAVFAALIGGDGWYSVTPVTPFVWGGYYEPGGLIWRSRWVTTTGITECREALAYPGDPHHAVLLRRLMAVDGHARVEVVLRLVSGFGRHPLQDMKRDQHGIWTGRSGDLYVRWSGVPDAQPAEGTLRAALALDPGTHHDLDLEISDRPLPEREPTDMLWRATETRWAAAIPGLDQTLAPRDARHACAVLAGMSAAGGGTVAAATTSLPERAEQGRHYDYRYVWIRDQAIIGQAAAAAGAHTLLDNSVRFVTARLLDHGPALTPAYTATGKPLPDQRSLDLPGYPGGFDVVGNQVNHQFQLDGFGEALLLLAAAARHDRLDTDGWRAAVTAVDAIAARRHEPDAGIWELHADRWTHSRLTCAAGLRALATAAPRADRGRAAGWEALADQIVAETASDCLHPTGRWQRSPTQAGVDAALLLPACAAPCPPTTRAPWPRCVPCIRSWRWTTTPTASVTTDARSRTRKARSCSAGSSSQRPSTSRATTSRRHAGSNATAPHAGPQDCSPRSSTSPRASCAAICRRPSSTRCCSRQPPASPARPPDEAAHPCVMSAVRVPTTWPAPSHPGFRLA